MFKSEEKKYIVLDFFSSLKINNSPFKDEMYLRNVQPEDVD